MNKKNCEICKKEFIKKVNTSRKDWLTSRFCSRVCSLKEPTRHTKQSETLKQSYASGKIKPWNKGIKTGHIPWNKGEVGSKYAKEHGYGKWMMGKKTPLETRIKLKLANERLIKEGKHNWYIDGRNPLNQKLRHSMEYRLWRESVFERDGYKCLWCGEGGYLQADHILRWADYPRLRFDINNGQTLCLNCHKVKTTSEKQRSGKLVFNFA